jgi:hypothetical protein
MRNALTITAGVVFTVTALLGSPGIGQAQSISPCSDCAWKTPCPGCPRMAACCFYPGNTPQEQMCTYLSSTEGGSWSIQHRGIVDGNCFVSSGGGNDQDCYGPECGGYDPCAGGGCEPGFGPCDREYDPEHPPIQDSCGCCADVSPILVSLRGAGYHVSSAEEGVLFDVNGLGAVMWVGWPTTTDNGWLALDPNGNGKIDSGAELFGNATRLANGKAAANGYLALAELDENHDGWIDSRDPAFARLVVWIDANRNGISEPSELIPLSAASIVGLSTEAQPSGRRDGNGNEFKLRAKMLLAGGQERFSYEVYWTPKPESGVTPASTGGCSARTR